MSKVAVWMTNYASAGSDNERNLPKAIASVLNQEYRDFVLYIFDNHSPSPEVHRAIAEAAAGDSRVVVVALPEGLAGIPVARYAWEFLNKKDHAYSITIGGHDYWHNDQFLKILVERMDAETTARAGNPDVALIYTDTWQVNGAGDVVGHFQDIMQIGGQIGRPFLPQYVVAGLDSPPFFGLWNEKVRKRVPIRYECGGFDHLVVVEASLRGMILWEPRAVLWMRAPPPGDGSDKYGARHFSKENLARGQQDFIDQLEWCMHCVEMAIEDVPPDAKPTYRMVLTASIVATYMTLRGTNLMQIPNAHQQFTTNPLVIEMMKGCNHVTRFADNLIRSSKPHA